MNASLKASDIFIDSQALLNDLENKQLFTNAALLPYLNIAMRELSEIYEENGLPSTKVSSTEINVRAGVLNIGGLNGPALPDDLVEINQLWERTFGTSVDYVKMSKRDYLPATPVITSYLQYYTWQKQVINFIGANADIGVKIDYIANVFPKVTDENSIIPIINSQTCLGFRTAGLAAEFIGENESRAASLNSNASSAVERLIGMGNNANQAIITRRRPFRANWKSNRSVG